MLFLYNVYTYQVINCIFKVTMNQIQPTLLTAAGQNEKLANVSW